MLRYLRKTLGICFRVLCQIRYGLFCCLTVGAIFLTFIINPPVVEAAWFSSAWQYRKSIHINSSADGVLTNYEKKITVNYGAGTDSDMDVYLNSKSNIDFGDIRFATENGTELDYYLLQKTDSDKATFFVEINSIPASGGTDVYIYYGNVAASTTSNGSATFDHFEDFDDSSWLFDTAGSAGVTFVASTTSCKEGGGCGDVNNPSMAYRTQMQNTTDFDVDEYIEEGWLRIESGATGNDQFGPGLHMAGAASSLNGYQAIIDYRSAESPQIREDTSNTGRTNGAYQIALNTWYLINLYRDNGSDIKSELFTEGAAYTNTPTTTTVRSSETTRNTGRHGVFAYSTAYSNFDAIWIRNRTEDEPTFGFWSLEEEVAPIIEITGWLNSSWQYRKPLNIESSVDGTLLNYEKKIVVNYGSGTDSGMNVYLDSKCKTDFGDIRFTSLDGVELDYYLIQKIDSDKAVFYVEIDSIPLSGGAGILIYYGNSSASTTSNGSATFDHFEDFDDSNILFDTAGASGITFSTSTNSCKEGSGCGDVNHASNDYRIQMQDVNNFSVDNYVQEGWLRIESGAIDVDTLGPGLHTAGASSANSGYQATLDGRGAVSPQIRVDTSYTLITNGSYLVSLDTWYLVNLYRANSNSLISELYTESAVYTGTPTSTTTRSSETTYSTGRTGVFTYSTTYSNYDAIWIRSYTNNEPAYGSWEDEQEFTSDEMYSPSFRIRGDALSAGSASGSSTNFGILGEINPFAGIDDSASFRTKIGYNSRIEVNTPYAPALINSDNSYSRLTITLSTAGNPTDTLYAVKVSSNDFSSYQYVQNDGTVGDTLGIEDYRTYDSWGGSSGSYILDLMPKSTYKARVKALQGDFTETEYSPESNASTTTVPYVNMSVSKASLTLGTLNINSISQTTTMNVAVNTNGYTGYQVYINDDGNGYVGGLFNGSGSTIMSADMVLTPGVEGYGVQASSATAVVDSKYNVSGNTVGGLEISTNPIFSNTVGVADETATLLFKATMSPNTIAGEYTDIVYFTVTPNL